MADLSRMFIISIPASKQQPTPTEIILPEVCDALWVPNAALTETGVPTYGGVNFLMALNDRSNPYLQFGVGGNGVMNSAVGKFSKIYIMNQAAPGPNMVPSTAFLIGFVGLGLYGLNAAGGVAAIGKV